MLALGDAELALEHDPLQRRQCDVGVAVIVESRRLAGHPAQDPDVQALVLEHEPVAPASAIAHDQRLPEVAPERERRDEPSQRIGVQRLLAELARHLTGVERDPGVAVP